MLPALVTGRGKNQNHLATPNNSSNLSGNFPTKKNRLKSTLQAMGCHVVFPGSPPVVAASSHAGAASSS